MTVAKRERSPLTVMETMTKKGFFKKTEYVYDEYYDCYICPVNKLLHYSTTNREGYREYKSNHGNTGRGCQSHLYMAKIVFLKK